MYELDDPARQRSADIIAAGEARLRELDEQEARRDAPIDKSQVAAAARSIPRREPYRPFPVELLPEVAARFVTETAAAIGCDPAMVGTHLLSVLSASVGTTRVIELKRSWCEYPLVWAAVVVRSGSIKSPSMDAPLAALRAAQERKFDQYNYNREEYETAKLRYEKSLATWKANKKDADADPPERPDPPACVRYIVSDTTIEALAPILQLNPRGVLLARDELAGWLQSFNQYKAGKGSDAANWLETHRAGTVIIDRKTAAGPIRIARAAVSICGTVQPGVMLRLLTSEHFDSGLVARLLIVHPPDRMKKWTERVPSVHVVAAYEKLIGRLLDLTHTVGEYGPEPIRVPMSKDARRIWISWFDEHAKRIADAGNDREAAALAKLEAYAARFALLFTLAENPDATIVTADAMRRGCALADWFSYEARRVYSWFGESDDDRERRQLVEWIERRGGTVTPRDLVRNLSRYRDDPDSAAAELDALARAGYGRMETVTGGGRPSTRFVLTDADESVRRGTTDTTDADESGVPHVKTGAFVGVGNVGDGADDESEIRNFDEADEATGGCPERFDFGDGGADRTGAFTR